MIRWTFAVKPPTSATMAQGLVTKRSDMTTVAQGHQKYTITKDQDDANHLEQCGALVPSAIPKEV